MDWPTLVIPVVLTAVFTAVQVNSSRKLSKLDLLESSFQKHLVDDAKMAGHIEELKPQLDKIGDRLDRLIEKERD